MLASRAFPLTRYVPLSSFALYDVQRFAQSRRLDVIFDVGANIGQSASDFTRYFPDAAIYCFEPGREAFTRLRKTYGGYPRLRCLNIALGERAERRELAVPDGDTESSTFAETPAKRDCLRETCEVVTIDEFCANEKIVAIDLLKMDVQGWEFAVLHGAQDLLRANRIRFVLSEVGFIEEESDMIFFPRLHQHMQVCGFRLCGFYDTFHHGPQKQYVGFSNALYVNPEWSS